VLLTQRGRSAYVVYAKTPQPLCLIGPHYRSPPASLDTDAHMATQPSPESPRGSSTDLSPNLFDPHSSSTATTSVSPAPAATLLSPRSPSQCQPRNERQAPPHSDSPHGPLGLEAGKLSPILASAALPVLPPIYTSTPCRWKAVSILLSLESVQDGYKPSSATRHHRRAKAAAVLRAAELHQATHRSSTFPEDFLLRESWGLHVSDAELILSEVSRQLPPADNVRHHPTTSQYSCRPPDYSNADYPEWFCRFANGIRDAKNGTPPLKRATWVSTKNSSLTGVPNGNLRPDFVLTVQPDAPTWSSVLVVGEHQQKHSNPLNQLAAYAEQVFIAQPFRNAVLGVLTSNTGPLMTFWRFDRAGALGSLDLDYRSTAYQLNTVVRCLHAIPRLPANAMGFHVASITTTDLPVHNPFPLDCTIAWGMRMTDPTHGAASMQRLLFVAPGLVSRGTRVWRGQVGLKQVAIKYSWRSAQRTPEVDSYHLASARNVIGIAELLAYDTYEDILSDIRLGYGPTSKHLEAYNRHMETHNKHLTRLILTPVGRPISDSCLTPVQIARALLTGLIGHASLFFDAGILHRDLSPQNIIYAEPPRPATHSWLCSPDTHLYGCLIDFDYAIDTNSAEAQASGAADCTGTYPFIAIRVLSRSEPHRYRHDLESLLYILLWVSCYPVPVLAPVSPRPESKIWPRNAPLKMWITADEQTLTAHKTTNIVTDKSVFEQLLERFRPGFGPFKEVARKLRRTLWGLEGLELCAVVPEGMPGENLPSGRRSWLMPGEVRIGVDNREAYGEAKRALEGLVYGLEVEHDGSVVDR